MRRWILFLILLLTSALFVACGSDDGDSVDGDTDATDGDQDAEDFTDGDGTIDGDEDTITEGIEPHLEQHGNFTIAWLRGTPYEMGYQHGEMFYDVIVEAMEFVAADPILKSIPGLAASWGIIDMAMENSYDDLLEECQGLVDAAEGTGFSMEYCLVLNFGDVLLENIPISLSDRTENPLAQPGCSQLIVSGEATEDGRLYHARNLDWGAFNIDIIHSNPVIFIRQPSDGIAHAVVGFPLNISPYTGMNAAGVSGSSNEVDPAADIETPESGRSHVQMLGKALKTVESLDDVKAFIEGEPNMSSETLVFADGNTKQAAVFELSPAGHVVREFTDDLVFATNHFVSEEMVDLDAPEDPIAPSGSLLRFDRLGQLVNPDDEESNYGQLLPETLASVMRDRINARSGDTAPEDEIDVDWCLGCNGPMHFVLFDPEKLLFWVAAGQLPIWQQPYKCFSLGELLGLEDAVSCPGEQID